MIGDKKKKKVSKKSKRAWRKHTNVEDVENFLEEKRSDQRLGIDKLSSRKDADLFVLDAEGSDTLKNKGQGKPRSKAEKKLWACEPSSYQLGLIPRSAVEDPIQRNRVRSKEERKHPARKAKDLELLVKGSMRKKAKEALKNRKLSLKNNKKQLVKQKIVGFNSDVWNNETESQVDDSWLGEDARREALKSVGEFKVKPPRNLALPRSKLPKLEPPHPGHSYNPSLADHKELISRVVDKEVKMMKADAHITRVTAPFRRKRQQSDWVEGILQGLGIGAKDEEEAQRHDEGEGEAEADEGESKAEVLMKTQPKMKTRKQRRAQKRIRQEAQQRKHKAAEKKKTTDILQLKNIVSGLDAEEAENEKASEAKREAKLEYSRTGTKRLARLKYVEPLEEYSNARELTGSLRSLRARQTLLRDRFNSMQKRNILQPTARIFRTKKRKVKVYTKRDHRIEEDVTKKLTNKIKVIDTV